jgi:hypothetical protein
MPKLEFWAKTMTFFPISGAVCPRSHGVARSLARSGALHATLDSRRFGHFRGILTGSGADRGRHLLTHTHSASGTYRID